jgi:hypothetical protein
MVIDSSLRGLDNPPKASKQDFCSPQELHEEKPWSELRNRALTPLYHSGYATSEADRAEFLTGATLLRLTGQWSRPGHTVQPQQVAVADTLATGKPRTAVLMPRRSSKTTSLLAVALGRAYSREDYRVGILTLTSGKAGRSRFLKDVAPALDRILASYGEERTGHPFRVVRSAGQERVEFKVSGGSVSWLSSVDDLRGEAFDLIILDEAQAADPEKARDVIAAALPTLDTRPGAQIVVAGTAGGWRAGNLLHDWLEQGRAGKAGIIEYAMPEDTPDEVFNDWETLEPYIVAAHPGIGTLTTLEAVRSNYDALARETFAQEYGGIWGSLGEGRTALRAEAWHEAGQDTAPIVPERFALAAMPSFTGAQAALVAAWRDEQGRAHGYVLDYRKGTTWLAAAAAEKARQHAVPIVYDSKSSTMRTEVEVMERMKPRPRLAPQTYNDVTAAASLLVKDVNNGNAVHYKQPALEDAARVAVRRTTGANAWALGRPPKDEDADICALEAWSLALRYYDDNQRRSLRPIMAA